MAKEIRLSIAGKSLNLTEKDFEDATTMFPAKLDAEGKELEMSMTVDSSADYATNAKEYFVKAMIGEEKTRSKFRQLLGVKDRIKLGTVDTSALSIKAGAATFDPDTTTISQKDFEVKPLMMGTSFNVSDLEQSFVSDQLKKGSNNFSDKFEFMNFFYAEVARWLTEQMELITFVGTVAANGVDGLETLLAADGNVLVPATPSAVTSANIIDKLKEGRDALPKAVRRRPDFVYIVSTNTYDALADSVSENKASGLYYIEGETLRFQGVQVYKADGASDDVIIATYFENLLNIQDVMGEELGFNIVDFMKTALNRTIGVRVDFKYQPDYVNSEEIYFHTT